MPNLPYPAFNPPWWLRNGLAMTVYTALRASQEWEKTTLDSEPSYQKLSLQGQVEYLFLVGLLFLKILLAQLLALMALQVL